MIRTFHTGGIHVPEMKNVHYDGILTLDLPERVDLPLKQHIGLPAEPLVAKGDHVSRGQKIAEARGKVGAPIHASISGTVTAIGPVTMGNGMPEQAITILASEEDHAADKVAMEAYTVYSTENLSANEIVATIADAGVVGLGGATFPTAVKLSPPPDVKIDVLVINGAECEPVLTCDDMIMRYRAHEIAEGISLMIRASGVKRCVVGIEDNKPQAILAMKAACAAFPGIKIQALRTKYPQGGEKQLIYSTVGRIVPEGKLPASVGVIVQNVGTALAVYNAVVLREPLIRRVITIDHAANVLVPIGMNIADIMHRVADRLPNFFQFPEGEWDVVNGGPMMGRSMVTLDAPVTKGTSGITLFRPLSFDPQPCIRCGACVEACPMALEPYRITRYGRFNLYDEAAAAGAMACIECGSCNFSCPSERPILEFIRHAKAGIKTK